MSEDIRKEPVSPLRAEPPLAPLDRQVADDGARTPSPLTMGAAGAVWIVAGGLLFLLVPPLLYEAWLPFQYFLHGVAYPVDLGWLLFYSALAIIAALSGALFIRAGIRILRGAGPSRRGVGLAVYSLVAASILILISLEAAGGALDMVLNGLPLAGLTDHGVAHTAFGVVGVLASLLLLTAGVLALAGGSRYELWRKAQELSRRRGANADNPFRK
jgi:hypothetical protein